MISRHIFLVGFMGAGKSTVGRLVAERLDAPFIDLDELIVEESGMPIAELFSSQGEERFRDIESSVLSSVVRRQPAVVACGGGVVVRPENRALLKQYGVVVYLVVTAGEAVARIGDVATRPLLAGPSGVLAATSLLSAREVLYESVADVTVDTSAADPADVAARLVSELDVVS